MAYRDGIGVGVGWSLKLVVQRWDGVFEMRGGRGGVCKAHKYTLNMEHWLLRVIAYLQDYTTSINVHL